MRSMASAARPIIPVNNNLSSLFLFAAFYDKMKQKEAGL